MIPPRANVSRMAASTGAAANLSQLPTPNAVGSSHAGLGTTVGACLAPQWRQQVSRCPECLESELVPSQPGEWWQQLALRPGSLDASAPCPSGWQLCDAPGLFPTPPERAALQPPICSGCRYRTVRPSSGQQPLDFRSRRPFHRRQLVGRFSKPIRTCCSPLG